MPDSAPRYTVAETIAWLEERASKARENQRRTSSDFEPALYNVYDDTALSYESAVAYLRRLEARKPVLFGVTYNGQITCNVADSRAGADLIRQHLDSTHPYSDPPRTVVPLTVTSDD